MTILDTKVFCNLYLRNSNPQTRNLYEQITCSSRSLYFSIFQQAETEDQAYSRVPSIDDTIPAIIPDEIDHAIKVLLKVIQKLHFFKELELLSSH